MSNAKVSDYLRNLTLEARRGHLSPVAGRGDQIDQILEILNQKRKANALLIGPAGAGKTAIAEGIALFTARYPESLPPALQEAQVQQLDTTALIAGTGLAGEHERRVQQLLAAVDSRTVLFIDEIHRLFGSGGNEGKTDTAQLLKTSLARDDFRVIAATTAEEYHRILARDSAFCRRFQIVYIPPLSVEATVTALKAYAQFRGKTVSRRLLAKIARLAPILCPTRALPDPAIDLLERSLSIADWQGVSLNLRQVERAAIRTAGLPVDLPTTLRKLTHSQNAWLARAAAGLLGLLHAAERHPLVWECEPRIADELVTHLSVILRQGILELDAQRSERELYGAEPGYIGHDNALPMHTLLESPFTVVKLKNVAQGPVGQRLSSDARRGWFEDTRGRKIPVSITVLEKATERRIGF